MALPTVIFQQWFDVTNKIDRSFRRRWNHRLFFRMTAPRTTGHRDQRTDHDDQETPHSGRLHSRYLTGYHTLYLNSPTP
jgi:hypothetical protein